MANSKRERAKNYLSENNRERLTDYINGYYAVPALSKESNIDSSILYLAISDLDPSATEKRKEIRVNILKDLVNKINMCIPYERMDLDIDKLMGKDSGFVNKPIAIQKKRLSKFRIENSQRQLDFDKNFEFLLQKKVNAWYRNYQIHKEIEQGEVTPYKIAKKYNVDSRKVYELSNFFVEKSQDQSTKKIGVTFEQKQRFLENVKIFEDYEAGNNVSELASKYKITEELIEKIVASIEVAKKSLVCTGMET